MIKLGVISPPIKKTETRETIDGQTGGDKHTIKKD